jgi:site-specific recombinase XerD
MKDIKKDFTSFTKEEIKSLCASINNSDYAEWTKHDRLVAIKRFMKFLYEQKDDKTFDKGEYPDNVKWIRTTIKDNRTMKPKDLLTPDDIKKLANQTNNLRDRALVMVLFESGARVGEAQEIRVKDVVFDKYGALLDLHGKTGSRRIRLISSAPSISNWLLDHPEKSEPQFHESYLFASLWGKNRGGYLSYVQINLLLREAAKKAGIQKPVRPHWFRHSRATMLARQLPEAVMCEFFGWKPGSKEVGTYTHLSAKNIDNAILKLHGIKAEEDQDTKRFEPIVCPRCGIKNDPGAKYCSGCSLGLDEKSVMEFDRQKELESTLGSVTLESLKKNPELEKYIGELVLKQIQEALKKRGD